MILFLHCFGFLVLASFINSLLWFSHSSFNNIIELSENIKLPEECFQVFQK